MSATFPMPLSFILDSPTSVLAEAMQHLDCLLPLLGLHLPYTLSATALVEASPSQPLPFSRTKLSCHLCIYLGYSRPHNFAGFCAERSKEIGFLYPFGALVFHLVTKAALMDSEQTKSLQNSFICYDGS